MKPFMHFVTADYFWFCLCIPIGYVLLRRRVQCILFSIHIDFLLAEIIVFLRGWFGFVSNHALINFDHLLNKEAILYPLCLFSLSHIVRLPINIFVFSENRGGVHIAGSISCYMKAHSSSRVG
jgi:hypothetical protein